MNYSKKNKKYFDPIVFSNDCNYNPWGTCQIFKLKS